MATDSGGEALLKGRGTMVAYIRSRRINGSLYGDMWLGGRGRLHYAPRWCNLVRLLQVRRVFAGLGTRGGPIRMYTRAGRRGARRPERQGRVAITASGQ